MACIDEYQSTVSPVGETGENSSSPRGQSSLALDDFSKGMLRDALFRQPSDTDGSTSSMSVTRASAVKRDRVLNLSVSPPRQNHRLTTQSHLGTFMPERAEGVDNRAIDKF